MAERTIYLTVVLDEEYSTDNVQPIVHAISMTKGVAHVGINIKDPNDFAIRTQVKCEIRQKLFEAVKL